MRTTFPTSRGLSLLELLVSIALLAALFLLAFPIYKTARARMLDTQCITNLRQVGKAVALYRAESNDQLPAAVGGYYPLDWGGVWYKPQVPQRPEGLGLAKYVGGEATLASITYCPHNRDPAPLRPCVHPHGYPYLVNYFLMPSDPMPLRRGAEFSRPSRTVLMLDSQNDGTLWGLGTKGQLDGQGGYRIRDAHLYGANILWADGSVSGLKRSKLIYANFTGIFD